MINPRLRLYVCATAVVVTLGGAVLTQAAGPGEFISRLWKREPAPNKEVTSGLSPFRWLRGRKSEPNAGCVKVSDGGRTVVSERPELISDPFLAAQQTPRTQPVHENSPTANASRTLLVRPQPTQHSEAARLPEAQRNSPISTPAVGRSRLADLTSTETSSRSTISTQHSAPTRPAENGVFVNGFDGDFQKLVDSVVAESRQKKKKITSSPSLPDDVGANTDSPQQNVPSETTVADSPAGRQQFAQFAQKRTRGAVDDLIRESRRQMDSSVHAQKATGEAATQRTASTEPFADQSAAERNDVAAASHSHASQTASPHSDSTEANFLPQRLPDQLGHNGNQLVVPSAIVPERELFTPTETWRNRNRNQRHEAAAQADSVPPQPVVRVIPGSRGDGVMIESGQWSLIRPRVSSNVAPSRSVPDTSKFRRLSFDGADGTPQKGAVLAIGKTGPNRRDKETNTGQADQSTFVPAELAVPPQLRSQQETENDLPIMLPPDPRTAPGMDAAELGAALSAAPGPPQMERTVFEWPDESEFASGSPTGGVSWGTVAFSLLLTAAAASLFFRRRRQDGAFGITGTGSEPENS